ncbi:hypothetical protein [uncultured Kriegella sp.]|uniref:hypothetical protein n=1 Tax=uncultured Kriegella sp. TaxID=1798910 RepID=UPI0030D7CC31|tara:strand:- start:110954 stop:111325 length:372 start_codon:yes stop_codon:yes gene_type:complete
MMLKQLIPVLALIMLLKPVWPLAEYMLNYDYIVENLCENRAQPMLNCNGKCYLAKKLAEESGEEEQNPFNSEISKFEIPIIDWMGEQYRSLSYFDFVVNNHKRYANMTSNLFATDILHPPRFS